MSKFLRPVLIVSMTILGSVILECRAAGLETSDLVRTCPAPAGEPLSKRFAVTVEQKDVPAYLARVVALTPEQRQKLRGTAELSDTSEAAFASVDIGGSVHVSVTSSGPVQSAKLLPASSGITPVISGNRINFTVAKPGQLTLEVNGDWVNSLHLFVNPFEPDVPRPDDPNVIYFGPGAHEVDSVKVGSGKTVYLADGAVVYGKPGAPAPGPLFDLNGSNIVLRGRGIIDGSRLPRSTPRYPLVTAGGTNIAVDGVVLRDSCTWTFRILKAQQVSVRNVKIFGWRGNSDGIDICNSGNVQVSDCFLRTFDDLVVIKTFDPKGGPSHDISVKTCVLWNEFAHALSLGAELRTPVENVLFSDCDIIHDKGRQWDLRVYHCDSAPIKNIVFEKIRIGESRRLFSLWIGQAMWSKDAQRGHIDDVTFRDITSVVPERAGPAVDLKGFDAEHAIHNAQFIDVRIGGKPITPGDVKQNGFVREVSVKP